MYPDVIDAGFSDLMDLDHRQDIIEEINNTLGVTNYLSLEEQLSYQYIFAVDGNSWSRMFRKALYSDTVPVKPHSRWKEFFDLIPELAENVHYIPVREDISDLVLRIQSLKEELVAASISETSRNDSQIGGGGGGRAAYQEEHSLSPLNSRAIESTTAYQIATASKIFAHKYLSEDAVLYYGYCVLRELQRMTCTVE